MELIKGVKSRDWSIIFDGFVNICGKIWVIACLFSMCCIITTSYVITASVGIGTLLCPSQDPVMQFILSHALCICNAYVINAARFLNIFSKLCGYLDSGGSLTPGWNTIYFVPLPNRLFLVSPVHYAGPTVGFTHLR